MDKREIIDIKGLPVYLQADVVVCGGGAYRMETKNGCYAEISGIYVCL